MAKEQRPVLINEGINIRQVDGSPLAVMGVASVDVQVGKTVHQVKAVFADIKCMGILGMDFLLPTRGNLDFQSLELRLNGERVRCTSSAGEPFVGRVVVTETTEIASGHEALVPGSIVNTGEIPLRSAIIEPVEGGGELAQRGLVLARSLVKPQGEVLPLRILNPSDDARVVRKGTTVGTVEAVEVESVVPLSQVGAGEVNDNLPKHLYDLYERSKVNLSEDYHDEVKSCLSDYQDVFSSGDHDIGKTNVVEHHIHTGDARPVKERPRRHPLCNQEEIVRQVENDHCQP